MKKIKETLLIATLITSCSTIPNNNIIKNEIIKPDVVYNSRTKNINEINSKDFKIKDLKYLYKGEDLKFNKKLKGDIVLVKITAKSPMKYFEKGDKDYDKYKKDDENYDVVEKNGQKIVKFLKEKTIFATVKDTKTGVTREIMLDHPIKLRDIPKPKNGMRYEELLKGVDNGRVKYEVVSHDDADPLEPKIYSLYNDYDDADDYTGKNNVAIKTRVGDIAIEHKKYEITFGDKIEDYKNKYEELLEDLDKKTLKFSNDYKSVEGGFKNRPLKYILQNYKEENPKGKLQFVTEIKGGTEGKKVGNHIVVRKIIENGKVIFQKEELAHVSFPGTTVAIADSTFFDVDDEIEKRIQRVLPKSLDAKLEKNKYDTFNLSRSHGTTVIGSMIDESVGGNANYVNLIFLTAPMKKLIYDIGYMQDFKPFELYGQKFGLKPEDTKDNEALYGAIYQMHAIVGANLKVVSSNYIVQRKYDEFDREFYKLNNHKIVENKQVRYYKDPVKIVNGKNIPQGEELKGEAKIEFLKSWYLKLYNILNEITTLTEKEKVKHSNMHFKVLPIGDEKQSLDTSTFSKYLSKVLDEDKNIKAINMSYGSSMRFEDYINIKLMTNEEKLRAVKEYNTNPQFRTAVKMWLQYLERNDYYKDDAEGGNLGIPKMLNYFNAKKEIDLTDYQNLLDLKALQIEQALKRSSELPLSNYDVLFVVSQGNTRGISGGRAAVDLTGFDEKGRKYILEDGDRYYGNNLLGIHSMINYKNNEKAKKENKKAKLDYTYRKNIIGVVGLASKKTFAGFDATDNISDNFGLYTKKYEKMNYATPSGFIMEYPLNYMNYYEKLKKELKDAENNPNKHKKGYVDELKTQIKVLEDWNELKGVDPNGRPLKMSFSRAGLGKIMSIAAEGQYYYVKKLNEEEKKKFKPKKYFEIDGKKEFNFEYSSDTVALENPGSSFAAPRVTATVGLVSEKYPWMSAHQIKQTIFTTATDDYRSANVIVKDATGKLKRVPMMVGIYGVDENIGWGILNKQKALDGPARFVKALTHEVGEENFVANVPAGMYTFSNGIEGGFDLANYMFSRNILLNELEMATYEISKLYTKEDLLSNKFKKNKETKGVQEFFEKNNIRLEDIHEKHLPKIMEKVHKFYHMLPEEERELFDDAGLEKLGKGILVLSGNNTYKGPTLVKEGTLILLGNSNSPITVFEKGKLKIDFKKVKANRDAKQNADVINEGKVFSHSNGDIINGTYKPKNNGKLYVSTNGKLEIDSLDLSEANEFKYDVFRPYGKKTLRKSSDVLIIKKIKAKDLEKLKLGEIPLSNLYKFVVNTKQLDKDGDDTFEHNGKLYKIKDMKSKFGRDRNKPKDGAVPTKLGDLYKVVIKLVKDNTGLQPEETLDLEDDMQDARSVLEKFFKEKIRASYQAADEIPSEELEEILVNLRELNKNEAKTLDGDVLANSQLLGYELQDLKQQILDTTLVKGKNNRFSTFAQSLNNAKFIQNKDKGNKQIFNNGILFGASYATSNLHFGAGLNYVNSKLLDFDIDSSDKVQGSVNANTIGAFGFVNYSKNNGYINTTLGLDYLSKSVDRKLLTSDIKDIKSNDIIFTTNVEDGYTFKLNNDKYELTPFAAINLLSYTKGKFSENTSFGYKSDVENFFKSYINLGLRGRVNFNEKLSLGLSLGYKKYLTDTKLKSNVELTDYKFKYLAKGINLEDNVVTYGIDVRFRPTDRLSLNAQYFGKNIKSHTINLGVKFEF